MVSSGLRIGRILGIPIFLHASWFIIFALITFSLRVYFKQMYPGWAENEYWAVGVATSLLFFGSVLFHELAHSVVALHYRIPVVSITLFVFGGVARIGREPSSARQEFYIAAAGPLSSYLLAGAFLVAGMMFAGSERIVALANWLAFINAILATFNLLPAFPLDGGRILRAAVWGWTGSYTRATRFAARGGQLLAYLLILLGVFHALTGNLVGGIWMAFIGWFVLTAAQESYAQVALRETLSGLRAGDLMSREVPVVPRNLSLEEYVHELLRTGRRCHLVMAGDELVGLMSLHAINRVPREDWPVTSVQAAMVPRERIQWTRPEESALATLERMLAGDINQMPVVVNGQVVGMISRESILNMLQTRAEMGRLAEM